MWHEDLTVTESPPLITLYRVAGSREFLIPILGDTNIGIRFTRERPRKKKLPALKIRVGSPSRFSWE